MKKEYKSITERNLKILPLGKNWVIYDFEENSFFCFGIKHAVFKGDVSQIIIRTPIEFTSYTGAEHVVLGKTTVAEIQRSLSNLNVGFHDAIADVLH